MRLLVIDDEVYTREGIMESMEWEALGISEVLDTDDGLSALAMLEWFQPDIILTDIRMPKMDGMAFAEKFLEKCPDGKIIFMSAYMEKQYYKNAIRLSAVDYVEKPLDLDELERAIIKAVEGIQKNRTRNVHERDSKLMLEERLANYLTGRRSNLTKIYDFCDKVNFPTEGRYISFMFHDLEKDDDRQGNVLLIRQFFEEEDICSITAPMEKYNYLCIIALRKGQNPDIHKMLGMFLRQSQSFQIGVGFEVDSLSGISESYRIAEGILNNAFYNPKDSIFELTNMKRPVMSVNAGIYTRLHDTIYQMPDRLLSMIDMIFTEFSEDQNLHPDSIRSFSKAVIQDLLVVKKDSRERMVCMLQGIAPEDYIDDSESLQDIHEAVRMAALLVLDTSEKVVNLSPIIRNAAQYIRNNCRKSDLGLQDVADYCNLSTGYLSGIFKKEMGMTVRKYIEDYRIELAKEQLSVTRDRISDISEQCGFAQAGYFSRVFKQKEGMTPAEYRELHHT